ncbi:hypothetical protein OKA05_11435 [Luteolibacter arcticus]|uniref:Uncharacterized protein n=1 Tax=Luteolibacter arcticus TaxID=1581411 RepID=A0ABT3GI39_9BACT|nr:hypothetical protein [Luteolibacter arcticus]MCW1923167.1 hypothetical protein [Luteolibacter arcticus]
MDLLSRLDAAELEPFVENEDPVVFKAGTYPHAARCALSSSAIFFIVPT